MVSDILDIFNIDVQSESDSNGNVVIKKVEIDPLCLLSSDNIHTLEAILNDTYFNEDVVQDVTEDIVERMRKAEVYESYRLKCPICSQPLETFSLSLNEKSNTIACAHCCSMLSFDSVAKKAVLTDKTTHFNAFFKKELENYKAPLSLLLPSGYERYETIMVYFLEKSFRDSLDAKKGLLCKKILSWRELKSLVYSYMHECFYYFQQEQSASGYKFEIIERLKAHRTQTWHMLFSH